MLKYLKYLAIPVLIAVGIGYYWMNKAPAGLKNSTPAFQLAANVLFAEFSNDETAANTKYLDKVLQVTGTIADVKKGEGGALKLTLESGDDMFGIICEFDASETNNIDQYKPGQSITLKGLCTGILMDVVLIRCIAIK